MACPAKEDFFETVGATVGESRPTVPICLGRFAGKKDTDQLGIAISKSTEGFGENRSHVAPI